MIRLKPGLLSLCSGFSFLLPFPWPGACAYVLSWLGDWACPFWGSCFGCSAGSEERAATPHVGGEEVGLGDS